MLPHTVYVLESLTDHKRHYTGRTSSNVSTRHDWHNAGGSAHTAKHRAWKVIVAFSFEREGTAIAFEKYLKSGSGRPFAKRHFV